MMKPTFEKTIAEISRLYPGVRTTIKDGCLLLEGEMEKWDDVVKVGYLAAQAKSEGVINNIKLKGYTPEPMRISSIQDSEYDGLKCDALIVGGGIVGTAILREFSKYDVDACLIEKENDVALHASSRNDGCIHVGMDLSRKTKKHHYLRRAVQSYEQLAEDLGVDYVKHGQTLVFTKTLAYLAMPFLFSAARKKGIKGVRLLKREELLKREPNIGKEAKFAVFFPEGAVVSPYNMVVALAENAIENGGRVLLDTAALKFEVKDHRIISVKTNRGIIYPRVVINAAGVFADIIAGMAGDQFFSIHPRRGVEMILDKKAASKSVNSTLSFYAGNSDKKAHTKGGGIIPTVDGNTVVGPTASECPEREDYQTTKEEIDALFDKHRHTLPSLSRSDVITYFAGIRASTYEEDFIVRRGKWTENIIHAAGIQSPGLTAAPAIAEDIVKIYETMCGEKLAPKKQFNPTRKSNRLLKELSVEERDKLIKSNPDYGQIICRCEEISKGEILDCLRRPLKVHTTDGVKRRIRAGMGRCQGGFCQQLIVQIMAEEQKALLTEIKKKGEAPILLDDNKGGMR